MYCIILFCGVCRVKNRIKKIVFSLIILVALIFGIGTFPIINVSADTETWGYYLEFTVQDTSGADRTNVPVILSSLIGSNLVNAGYIDSDGLDTNLKETTTAMEYLLSTTNGAMVIPNLAASQTRTYRLYMNYSPDSTGFPIIVGDEGYMTVVDAASLELGDNFEIEVSGYVDTDAGADKNIVFKDGSFLLYISAAGTITADILSTTSTTSSPIRPNGAGDESYAGTFTNVGDGSDSTHNSTASASYLRSLFTHTDFSPEEDVTNINSVTVYFSFKNSGIAFTYAKPAIKIGTTVYDGIEQKAVNSYTTKSQVYTTSPATGLAWTESEINDMQIGYSYKTDSGYTAYMYDIWIVVNYSYNVTAKTVSCSGLDSGDYNIKVTADGTDLNLYIDDVLQDSEALSGVSVLDNASDWLLFQSNVMSYVDYYKQTVGGTLIARYQPASMITSTTVPDLEGAAQNGTITWGSNSNLTITMLGIVPFTEYVSESGADEIADTIKPAEMPDTWYSDITNIADLPFYETFNEKATEMGMPTQTLYVMMMLGTAVAVGLGVLVFTGSALVAVLTCGVTIAAGVNTGILSGWMMLIFFIFGIGILYLSRQN